MPKEKLRKPHGFKKKTKKAVIVTREEWGARDPLWRDQLQLPVYNVMIKYYTNTPNCYCKEECMANMRELQRHYIDDMKLPDIPYNFVIGGDEAIYEGRGWFTAPTKLKGEMEHWEDRSIDIAYMGNPMPGKNMTPACGDLLEYAIDKKALVGKFDFEVLSGYDEPPPSIKHLDAL